AKPGVLAMAVSGVALIAGAGVSTPAIPLRIAGDSAAIRVHLLGHAIGSERYVVRSDNGALTLTDTFAFTDRGGRVQLASTLRYTTTFEPLHLRAVGRTYRFVNVDADIAIDNGRARVQSLGDTSTVRLPRVFFPIAGYAPLQTQALLVRYWETH